MFSSHLSQHVHGCGRARREDRSLVSGQLHRGFHVGGKLLVQGQLQAREEKGVHLCNYVC